jgi:hypothetical protein
MSTTMQEHEDWLKLIAPASVSALLEAAWNFVPSNDGTNDPESMDPSFQHMHVDHLKSWACDTDIVATLENTELMEQTISRLGSLSTQVGLNCQMFKQQLGTQFHPDQIPIHVLAGCMGCNTPYDNGDCSHAGRPPKLVVPAGDTLMEGFEVSVHRLTMIMAVVTELLTWKWDTAPVNSENLANALVQEAPASVTNLPQFFLSERLDGRVNIPPMLVGLIDNCERIVPVVANKAVALLALILSRRPSVLLASLDPEPLCAAMMKYLEGIAVLVMNNECMVEEHYGQVYLLNTAPLLYFMGEWKESSRLLQKYGLPSGVASLAINVIHSAAEQVDTSHKVLMEEFPELSAARLLVAPLYGQTGKSLFERPMSLVAAALTEVLGRWQHRGVPVTAGQIPVRSGTPATVGGSYDEYEEQIRVLVKRNPGIAFMTDIASHLIAGTKPPLPHTGTLRGPLLHASMVCTLRNCSAKVCEDGQRLWACGGACNGLARYCSKEHQREHWPQHRRFCKRQAAPR